MMTTPTGQEIIARELDRLCRAIDGLVKDLGDFRASTAVLVERTSRTDTQVARLEVRVEALEKRVYIAAGGAALIGMSVPFVTQLIAG